METLATGFESVSFQLRDGTVTVREVRPGDATTRLLTLDLGGAGDVAAGA